MTTNIEKAKSTLAQALHASRPISKLSVSAVCRTLDRLNVGEATVTRATGHIIVEADQDYIEVWRLPDGRWVRAIWDADRAHYSSADFSDWFQRWNPGCCYCVARTLEGLDGDIRSYASPAAAVLRYFQNKLDL